MARLKLLLAFGLGWSSVALVQLTADAALNGAAAARVARTGSVAARVAALDHYVSALEQAAAAGKLGRQQVTAPFEVVNRAGQRLLYVTTDRDVEFYQGGKIAAQLSAAGGLGTVWAMSSNGSAALTGKQLLMKQDDHLRVALGKEAVHGNYRLQIASAANENIAGLGVSWETWGGVALVFDAGGTLKADMTAAANSRGNVAVLARPEKPLAILTQDVSGSGYFVICSAGGCLPPLVEAMDGGGYGIIGTGPSGWAPGAGFVIAAGSVISGKH